MKPGKLSRAALDYLEARGIRGRAAAKRRLRVIEGKEAEAVFASCRTFLVIPYFTAEAKPLLNLHTPFVRGRILGGKGLLAGTPTKGMKFMQPKGTQNHLYLDPARRDWPALLANAEKPLVITEGEVKAMCANEHGIACVAIGGVWSWKTRINGRSEPLPEFDAVAWTGRQVELAFDSDTAANAQVMAALHALALELTKRGAAVAQIVIPAGDSGEKVGLDDYLMEHGAKGFAELQRTPIALVLSPASPTDSARALLGEQERTLYWGGAFYSWRGDHYAELSEGELRAKAYAFLETAQTRDKDGALRPFNPTQSKVSNVVDALRAACHLSNEHAPPCWIDSRNGAPPAQELIAMRNGLLHVPSGKLLAHGPDLFNLNALSFDYEPSAPPPKRWHLFLKQIWPDDPESIEALQEWFGYYASGDSKQQKILLLVGPKRAGKGTIAGALQNLLGELNVAAPTLSSLSANFGLAPLIGKSLAVIGDARFGGRAAQQALTERLLSISGQDTQTIDRKYGEHWTGKLGVRFLLLSNEVPRIADASGALASRFIVLRLVQSFYGKEDLDLADALRNELPGILQWALEGQRRLRKRGHFLQPRSAKEEVELLEDLTSPVSAFLRERCKVSQQVHVERGVLYNAWESWCRVQGRTHPGTLEVFGRDLRAAVPGLRDERRQESGRRFRMYGGVTLLADPSGQARPGQSSISSAGKK